MNEATIHPFFWLLLTMLCTLLGKYIWDRYLSQSSRVTAQKCNDNQARCFGEVTLKIEKIGSALDLLKIQEFHINTTRTLKVILVTISELCEVIDACEEGTRERIRQEQLK